MERNEWHIRPGLFVHLVAFSPGHRPLISRPERAASFFVAKSTRFVYLTPRTCMTTHTIMLVWHSDRTTFLFLFLFFEIDCWRVFNASFMFLLSPAETRWRDGYIWGEGTGVETLVVKLAGLFVSRLGHDGDGGLNSLNLFCKLYLSLTMSCLRDRSRDLQSPGKARGDFAAVQAFYFSGIFRLGMGVPLQRNSTCGWCVLSLFTRDGGYEWEVGSGNRLRGTWTGGVPIRASCETGVLPYCCCPCPVSRRSSPHGTSPRQAPAPEKAFN